MLELIVLGKIPGTTIQINIMPMLLFWLVFFSTSVIYYLVKKVTNNIIQNTKDLLTLELISTI